MHPIDHEFSWGFERSGVLYGRPARAELRTVPETNARSDFRVGALSPADARNSIGKGHQATTQAEKTGCAERWRAARDTGTGNASRAADAVTGALRRAYEATFGSLPATLRRLSLLASIVLFVYAVNVLVHPAEAFAQEGPASGEGAGAEGFDPISRTLANIRDYLIRILVYFGGIAFACVFILMMMSFVDERARRGAKGAFGIALVGLVGGLLVTAIVQAAIGFTEGTGG